jgi:glycosyltransferase involved in cell wall biosynthesis
VRTTTFDDGGELIYVTLGATPIGSQRKYLELLRPRFGGRATPRASLLRYVPGRVALVAGDHWPEWREARDAGLPYIVDEHDVVSLRTGAGHAEERRMLEGALAVIFTSEDHRDYLLEQGVRLPPHEVVHLRPLAGDLDFRPLPKLPGKTLVYAGAVVREGERAGAFGYRCYHRIFAAFIRAGWRVHVFTPMHGAVLEELARLGVSVHPFVPHAELARASSQFTAGLHGYEHQGVPELAARYCNTCRPNKTWDYLAAGIPTICVNGGNSARVVEAGGWGVALESLEPEQLERAEPERLPQITEQLRQAQIMDRDAERLYSLVADALERAPARERRVLPVPDRRRFGAARL